MILDPQYLERDPFLQFTKWYQQAQDMAMPEANAVSLATCDPEGRPRSRTVLLKGLEADRFRFFTNYKSDKARDMDTCPYASLCFYWPKPLGYQVRVEGRVEKTSRQVSEEYFASRPRESQLGAWASQQSQPVDSKATLELALEDVRRRYNGKEVPCPPHWGGYDLIPDHFDFMILDLYRLHDRFAYKKSGLIWSQYRLNP